MAERERRDRQALQHVRPREREREHEERCAEEANEHDGEQQPAGEGERHVDGEPRGGVDEPRVRIERVEQRRRLRRVPAPGVEQLEPAQPVVAPTPGPPRRRRRLRARPAPRAGSRSAPVRRAA